MFKKSFLRQLDTNLLFNCPSSLKFFSNKLKSPPITHIKGEEYSRYATDLYLKNWINPFLDTSTWEEFDLSCENRQVNNDKLLQDIIASGKRTGAIFKEPILTPNEARKKEMNLKVEVLNPNAIFREAWKGVSISRDTIHIKGLELGYKNRVLFDRHAVGGEYTASWRHLGEGKLITTFTNIKNEVKVVDQRELKDKLNAAVVYHNPYDNIQQMARHFFTRCLEAKVTPYVVTKKTVFKWQEPFWKICLDIFNSEYKQAYNDLGLLKDSRGELAHVLSDVATMRICRWSNGGFGMCSLNYDGDVLTDEIAQVHRSRGFLTSVLNGINDDGTVLKEFEVSHGTNSRMWDEKLRGKETSFNPLSLIEALLGAIEHSVRLRPEFNVVTSLTKNVRKSVHRQMAESGRATRDISGSGGLNTEEFVIEVKKKIIQLEEAIRQSREKHMLVDNVRFNNKVLKEMFDKNNTEGDGQISFEGFQSLMKNLGAAPVLQNSKKMF